MGNKNYYLGLDMGTSSVGWAVTDQNYQLLRKKGKDMWGIREFDEANSAADRRSHRIDRRRRQRQTARIGLLKEYFADAIMAVDENFFIRLPCIKRHMIALKFYSVYMYYLLPWPYVVYIHFTFNVVICINIIDICLP